MSSLRSTMPVKMAALIEAEFAIGCHVVNSLIRESQSCLLALAVEEY